MEETEKTTASKFVNLKTARGDAVQQTRTVSPLQPTTPDTHNRYASCTIVNYSATDERSWGTGKRELLPHT